MQNQKSYLQRPAVMSDILKQRKRNVVQVGVAVGGKELCMTTQITAALETWFKPDIKTGHPGYLTLVTY